MRNINFIVTMQDSHNFAGYINHTRSATSKNKNSKDVNRLRPSVPSYWIHFIKRTITTVCVVFLVNDTLSPAFSELFSANILL